jgi:hypothetical protein
MTPIPFVDESVHVVAPRPIVNPVGGAPYLLMVPRLVEASAVPHSVQVPSADSTVRLMELATVPVTVRVPEAFSTAMTRVGNATSVATTTQPIMTFFICISLSYVCGFVLIDDYPFSRPAPHLASTASRSFTVI